MKQRSRILLNTLQVIVLAVLLTGRLSAGQILHVTREQQQLIGIKTQQPVVSTQSSYLSLPARVVVPPDQSYLVSAAQSGIVSKILVGEGDSVAKGQRLTSMSSPDLLRLQYEYLKANNQLKLDLIQLKRLRPLWEDGMISERRWLTLKSTVQLAQSTLKQQHSLLKLAGMSEIQIDRLRTRRELLQSLDVNSPVDGVILQRLVVPGQRVETMAALFHLADLSSLWLEIAVPVMHIHQVNLQDHVQIQDLDVCAGILLISRHVDPDNQTVLVRALITDPPSQVLVDQLVNVVFVKSKTTPLYRIPLSAVVRQEGKYFVFVQLENGFETRPIQITASGNQYVMVHSGLSADEKIAVKGIAALKAVWQNSGEND